MVMITPNFNFDGQCSEAIKLYTKAFNARIGCLLRYKDANVADYSKKLTDVEKEYIYHAECWIGDQRIMMCDNMEIPFKESISLSLVITMDTKEEVIKAYNVLKEGATIIHSPHSTTYSSCEVTLIDRFGFRWGIMTEQADR